VESTARREGGEFHSWNPKALTSLHRAVRQVKLEEYKHLQNMLMQKNQ